MVAESRLVRAPDVVVVVDVVLVIFNDVHSVVIFR